MMPPADNYFDPCPPRVAETKMESAAAPFKRKLPLSAIHCFEDVFL
jgi:hypothetical protein